MSDTRHDPVLGSGAEASDRPLGRIVVVPDNHIARALAAMATATGWEATLVDAVPAGGDVSALGHLDALVVCDHDADGALDLLRGALRSGVGYVAMMASRHRSAGLLAALRDEGFDDASLTRLHVPAGLRVGGRAPGEIALSVMAEVVADRHGQAGRPMREG